MLQRAASNACSWWWSSHVRTKQSKWLENSMQDMEEKVHNMVKLIEEDGDSFAKRAEMYYKRRPELISTVEESYRAFKALANRYDLLSKELQNANKTIATFCPEQLQLPMDDVEECPPPKLPRKIQTNPGNKTNIPKVPKPPIENLKGLISTASKQIKSNRPAPVKNKIALNKAIVNSGLTKDEALVEIDNTNKDILSLQTVKEFVKSSYESGLAKYWAIDNQIVELQDKVVKLQDEFDVESVIDDNEARTLMTEAALKSCQETLSVLQEKQEKSTTEVQQELKKIESARQLLKSIRREFIKEDGQQMSEDETANEKIEILGVENKNEKTLDSGSMGTLTVTELAEKVDELVNKVISLETEVSSQTVMISTLRTEADDLHMHTQKFENEKESLIGDRHNLSIRVKEMEDKLKRVESLNKNVENQNINLQTNFSEARSCLELLSEKLSTVKPDEEDTEEADEITKSTLPENKFRKEIKDGKNNVQHVEIVDDTNTVPGPWNKTVEDLSKDVKEFEVNVPNKEVEEVTKHGATIIHEKLNIDETRKEQQQHLKAEPVSKEDNLNWQEMLLSETEDRETILLKEYTAILRNYKDVKKKLSDTEKKEKDHHFDVTVQMRDLKQGILKRDQEIQLLRDKLSHAQGDNNSYNNKNNDDELSQNEANEDIITTANNKEDEMRMGEISAIEEKIRVEIDAILDENLEFWLRFSTNFHQVQKFKSEVRDLQDEILKLKDKKKLEGSVAAQHMYEARPIYKHLREIQTELTVWLEESASLKDELKRRFESLCGIQEEITKELEEGVEEEQMRFSSHKAAKLQGEILNMKQENTKVRRELQTGLDHVSLLQMETEKTLMQVTEEFGILGDQPKLQDNLSKAQVPLRAFIFGTKAKKQKNSLFSFMHPPNKFMPPQNKFMPPNKKFHAVRAVAVGLPALTNH